MIVVVVVVVFIAIRPIIRTKTGIIIVILVVLKATLDMIAFNSN